MRIIELRESKNILLERVCVDLTPEQRLIVEGIYGELQPLAEATLSQDRIQALFRSVEDNMNTSGKNTKMLGKSLNAAKAVNDVINKTGKWLQDTTPVQGFDRKFEQLKGNIVGKLGKDSKVVNGINQLGNLAKAHPVKTAAVIGILTALASFAGGPLGGVIAGQVLQGTLQLIKGEKLSTAIGKGMKTAGLGLLTGLTFDQINDLLGKGVEVVRDNLYPGAVKANMQFTVQGTNGFKFEEIKGVYGKAEDVQEVRDAFNKGIELYRQDKFADSEKMFAKATQLATDLTKPDYVNALTDNAQARQTITQAARKTIEFMDNMKHVAIGANAAEVSLEKKTNESRQISEETILLVFEGIARQQELHEGLGSFAKKMVDKVGSKVAKTAKSIGKSMTTKVHYDGLVKAWKKAGAPRDSREMVVFFKQLGIGQDVVKAAFKDVGLLKKRKKKARGY